VLLNCPVFAAPADTDHCLSSTHSQLERVSGSLVWVTDLSPFDTIQAQHHARRTPLVAIHGLLSLMYIHVLHLGIKYVQLPSSVYFHWYRGLRDVCVYISGYHACSSPCFAHALLVLAESPYGLVLFLPFLSCSPYKITQTQQKDEYRDSLLPMTTPKMLEPFLYIPSLFVSWSP
jgi:hypothetical protein